MYKLHFCSNVSRPFSILHNSHEASQHTLPCYPTLLPLLHTSFSNKLGLIKERTDTACFKTGDRRLMEKDKNGRGGEREGIVLESTKDISHLTNGVNF